MITILMPVYNEGDFIYNNVMAVDSLLEREGIDHQFLLVDDGSRDKSWAELCRLADDHDQAVPQLWQGSRIVCRA